MAVSATQAVAVTPSDSVNLTDPATCLFIGTGGNVNLDTLDGGTVLYKNVASGSYIFQRTKRVRATSTTATDILAVYA